MSEKKFNILYVDDEPSNLRIFKMAFKRLYNIFTVNNVDEGIDILKNEEIHLIVTDQRMPHMTGVEFLAKILPEYPDPVRMILTGFSDVEAIIEAINSGRVYRYITKPWNKDELKTILDEALDAWSKEQHKREQIKVLTEVNLQLEEKVKSLKSQLSQQSGMFAKADR
mgnify:CR=1 FL=1